MKILFIISILVSSNAFSKEPKISRDVYNICKVYAFQGLTDWMSKKDVFYKITDVDSKEGLTEKGEAAVFVDLHFKDTENCSHRLVSVQCIPIASQNVSVQLAITDCNKAVTYLK